MNILEVQHVSHQYGKNTPFVKDALQDISIGFEKGKITGLLGHTGSGKSTLVQTLNGLLKPDLGTVLFEGKDIFENPKELRSIRFQIGLVMQYPEYQLFDDTVKKDIGYALRNMQLPDDEIEKRVLKAAQFVGLDSSVLEKSPFDLSGGQKRRVAIAGVIAMEPKVLILDEPAAGLDPRGRKEILGGLSKYQKETGITMIMVSHSMEDMALYCDNLVVLNESKVVLNGTVKEVFSHAEELVAYGLNVPQITLLVKELEHRGIHFKDTYYTVEDVVQAIIKYRSDAT